MKLEYPKKWFERSAEIEGTSEVGAGCPVVPCSACGGSGLGNPIYRPEVDKTQRDRCYTCQGSGIIGGEWDVERTHGRLTKVQYDIGCLEAEQYCAKLRSEGWRAWSIASDAKKITEVFYLPYTNTNQGQSLPSLPNE